MNSATRADSPAIPHCRFRDQRLEQRCQQLFTAISHAPTVNLKCLAKTRAEHIAYRRFLHHPATHLDSVIHGITADAQQRLQAHAYPHLLIVSDTSEINLRHQQGYHQRRGLGVVGNDRDAGFFIHPSIAIDPIQGHVLGCTSLSVWTRKGGCADRDTIESEKWSEAINDVHRMQLAPRLTFIHDREGEIFRVWQCVKHHAQHLLCRARQDRRIAQTSTCPHGKLFADLHHQPLQATISVHLPADPDTARPARESRVQLRWVRVNLLEPKTVRARAAQVSVSALEVLECPPDHAVNNSSVPVHWVLLTTHAIDTVGDAQQMLEWYLRRWRIEQCFTAVKTRGLNIESSRLHSGQALVKLGIMAFWGAVRLTALLTGREDTGTPATTVFCAAEVTCLQALSKQLEVRAGRRGNPYPAQCLAWAVWVIARLGSWHGVGPPGVEVLRRGLERFDAAFFGWNAHRPL